MLTRESFDRSSRIAAPETVTPLPEPAATGEEIVGSSALLAELEAAHCKADRLRGTAIRDADWPTYHEAHGEANGLRIAIAAVRRHSANDEAHPLPGEEAQ